MHEGLIVQKCRMMSGLRRIQEDLRAQKMQVGSRAQKNARML